MIRTKQKYIKNKKKFDRRLQMDNLMEKMFINMIKELEIKEDENSISFHLKNEGCVVFYDKKYETITFSTLRNMFVSIFGIDGMRANSFVKRMIIKYYELNIMN